MKRILLVNEYFSDNVGDQAIAKGASEVFSSKGYLVKCEGFSRDKAKAIAAPATTGGGRGGVKALASSIVLKSMYWLLKNGPRVIKASYKCEGQAVIGGGQLILANSSFAIAMFTWVLALRVFGKKVTLLSVGVGEGFGRYEKCLYKLSFAMASEIFIRERVGLAKLKEEFNAEGKYCPDTAYALSAPCRSVREYKVCTICITSYDVHVRYASELGVPVLSHAGYWEQWRRCVETYATQGYAIRFAWTTESDRYETIAFLEAFALEIEVSVFDGELKLNDVMDELSKSDVVVAGRMHALILAKICGCEVVPWVISKKIEIFSREYLSRDVKYLHGLVDATVDSLAL